jgi:hypothetical protein
VPDGLLRALASAYGVEVTGDDVFEYVIGVAGHPGFVAQFDDELHTPGVRIPVTADPLLFERACRLGRHVIWLHTFGEAGVHTDGFADIRDQRIEVIHPTYSVPVGPAMPEDWSYDATARCLLIGGGRWDDVGPEVVAYTVGGTAVLESWLGYRLARPRRRKTSGLDEINAMQWDANWSIELTNLLSILTQLVALEDSMDDLLQDIVVGPVLSRDELERAGVVWPQGDRRAPHMPLTGTLLERLDE